MPNEYIPRKAALKAIYTSTAPALEVKAIPAVDVVEVKHGRWMKSYADHEAFGVRPFFRYCSECHEATVHQYNYCPNCGTKMDGGHST